MSSPAGECKEPGDPRETHGAALPCAAHLVDAAELHLCSEVVGGLKAKPLSNLSGKWDTCP